MYIYIQHLAFLCVQCYLCKKIIHVVEYNHNLLVFIVQIYCNLVILCLVDIWDVSFLWVTEEQRCYEYSCTVILTLKILHFLNMHVVVELFPQSMCILTFIRLYQSRFQSCCTSLYSHQQCIRIVRLYLFICRKFYKQHYGNQPFVI